MQMNENGYGNFILEEDVRLYEPDEQFKSYHHQSQQAVSHRALLEGYLSLWLKRCVVSSPSRDNISSLALFLAIQLVFGKALGLLLTMVCYI